MGRIWWTKKKNEGLIRIEDQAKIGENPMIQTIKGLNEEVEKTEDL
jgi:hypothetical protein